MLIHQSLDWAYIKAFALEHMELQIGIALVLAGSEDKVGAGLNVKAVSTET